MQTQFEQFLYSLKPGIDRKEERESEKLEKASTTLIDSSFTQAEQDLISVQASLVKRIRQLEVQLKTTQDLLQHSLNMIREHVFISQDRLKEQRTLLQNLNDALNKKD